MQTWSRSIDELLPILEYDITKGKTYMYDKHDPLFEFGYGLSYTDFEYSNLYLDKRQIKDGDTITISLEVKNIGDYNSDEVIQLYVSYPNSKIKRPIKELKGFKRIHIKSKEMKKVSIELDTDELKYWNSDKQRFVLEKGKLILVVGASSDDLRLSAEINAI